MWDENSKQKKFWTWCITWCQFCTYSFHSIKYHSKNFKPKKFHQSYTSSIFPFFKWYVMIYWSEKIYDVNCKYCDLNSFAWEMKNFKLSNFKDLEIFFVPISAKVICTLCTFFFFQNMFTTDWLLLTGIFLRICCLSFSLKFKH